MASTKLGPRFERGEAAPRMRDTAREIIAEHGVAALSFRRLARYPGLKVSYSAPLHHFGTIAGLLGAVATEEFGRLAARLQECRAGAPNGVNSLVSLAEAYTAFATKGERDKRIYLAIHSSLLWSAPPANGASDRLKQNSPGRTAQERASFWRETAREARNEAFDEFVFAAEGALDGVSSKVEPEILARLVTVLVDGYLFQHLNEGVEPWSDPIHDVSYLVRCALSGNLPSLRGKTEIPG